MRIGIDAKELSKGSAGIAVYIRTMLDWFHEIDNGDNQYYLFAGRDFEMDPKWVRCWKVLYKIHTTGSFRVAYSLNRLIEEYKIDVFWGPEHCIPLIKGNFKRVVTIHDIAVILHPEWGTNYNAFLQKLILQKSLKNADRIVAISNSTKNDLITKFHIDESKVDVIYNGDSPYNYEKKIFTDAFEANVRAKYDIPGKYFYYCGTIEPRKNIISIVKAFENFMSDKTEEYRLVITGKKGWKYQPIMASITGSIERERIVLTGFVEEDEKEFLYSNATALVFPSFYEGLGLPIIEAMSCGTPVITARNSSLPEVGGDAAFYVDVATNVVQISELMNRINSLSNSEIQSVRNLNIAQARKFSKRKGAIELLSLFSNVFREKN